MGGDWQGAYLLQGGVAAACGAAAHGRGWGPAHAGRPIRCLALAATCTAPWQQHAHPCLPFPARSFHPQVVIDAGAVPIFVQLLHSPIDDVREQAVWALGNIAGDSPRCRDLVLQHGALAPLMEQLKVRAGLAV